MKRLLLLDVFAIFFCVTINAEVVDLKQLEGINIPLVQIETVNGEMPTYTEVMHPSNGMGASITDATKVPARMIISKGLGGDVMYDSGNYAKDESGITIKIRGNTSAQSVKKPYKIKLQYPADLLCRGNDSIYKDKDWALIRDESLLNLFGFKINELIGMQWTPAYEYVNLVINGEYKGLYLLVETVKRNKRCRLDVSKTGYVAEYDAYWWNEDVYVESPTLFDKNLMNYTFKYPDSDNITRQSLDYFEEMIERVEYSLQDGTYEKYIDTKSLASWILAQDILGNWDAGGSNYFFTKYDNTDESKIIMGCLWDFSSILYMKDDWSNQHFGWFYFEYLMEDVDFLRTYKARWYEISPYIFDDIITYLNSFVSSEMAVEMDKSLVLDGIRWEWENDSIDKCVDRAVNWFITRKIWMESAIGDIDNIPIVIKKPSTSDNLYYDLQGRKSNHPRKGVNIWKGRKYVW